MPRINAIAPKRCYSSQVFWDEDGLLAKPSRENFVANLNRLLAETGIKNAEIARRLGLSRSTIGRWIDGNAQPRYEELDALAKILKQPVAAFFEDPTDENTPGLGIDRALRMVVEAVKKSQKID